MAHTSSQGEADDLQLQSCMEYAVVWKVWAVAVGVCEIMKLWWLPIILHLGMYM